MYILTGSPIAMILQNFPVNLCIVTKRIAPITVQLAIHTDSYITHTLLHMATDKESTKWTRR